MLPEQIDLDQTGSVITAHLREKEVSHEHMQELVNECLERMRYHNARDVILDLSEVEFLCSACLGPLVSMLQDLEHVCGNVAAVNCSDNVAFLFKVTRLDSVIGLYDDEKEALAHL